MGSYWFDFKDAIIVGAHCVRSIHYDDDDMVEENELQHL